MARKGIEWVNQYHGTAPDLKNSGSNAQGFASALSGVTAFEFGDDLAWEQDFNPAGGENQGLAWAEMADIAYFCGHGSPQGLHLGVEHDHFVAQSSAIQLGEGSLKWSVLDAGEVLQNTGVFDRWGNRRVLGGLRALFSFHTTCSDSADRGRRFAQHMEAGETIRWAWIRACTETEDSGTECAYVRADSPMTDTRNDCWSDREPDNPDAEPPERFIYLRTSC